MNSVERCTDSDLRISLRFPACAGRSLIPRHHQTLAHTQAFSECSEPQNVLTARVFKSKLPAVIFPLLINEFYLSKSEILLWGKLELRVCGGRGGGGGWWFHFIFFFA